MACCDKCIQTETLHPIRFVGQRTFTLLPDQSSTKLAFCVWRNREELEAERSRRIKAEAIISRAKPGGLRTDGFPNVRDVVGHMEHLTDLVLTWTSKAIAIADTHKDLPTTMKNILTTTFVVCRGEVNRCLENKLQSLWAFLGNDEPVTLAGDESMNLDTQYVLYESLCKNFQTIVSVEPEVLDELANAIVKRCGELADAQLANSLIFGDARSAFDTLMKNYIMVFVEVR